MYTLLLFLDNEMRKKDVGGRERGKETCCNKNSKKRNETHCKVEGGGQIVHVTFDI